MENKDKIKREVKRKIEDVRNKAKMAQEKLEKEENPSDELKKAVNEMDDARKKLDNIYEGIKEETDVKWDEIEKNIFKDINTFNDAFNKAGKMFTGR
ncbi:MAG: hypothetical protein ACLFM1_08560 [Bacteroidales bacterium]